VRRRWRSPRPIRRSSRNRARSRTDQRLIDANSRAFGEPTSHTAGFHSSNKAPCRCQRHQRSGPSSRNGTWSRTMW
jgi:hypothetical protein